MRRLLFIIASLLGSVVFLAVGLTALMKATDAWESGVFGFTVTLLLISVLLLIQRTGEGRAFWLGFALFGWAYLVMSLVSPVEARLPTTRGLTFMDSLLVPGRAITIMSVPNGSKGGPGTLVTTFAFSSDDPSIGTSQGDTVRLLDVVTRRFVAGPNGNWENFMRIGHSLLAMLVAIFGGCLSRWLFDRQAAQQSGRPELSTAPASTPMA